LLDVYRRRLAFDDDRGIVRVIIRRWVIPWVPEWRANDDTDAHTAMAIPTPPPPVITPVGEGVAGHNQTEQEKRNSSNPLFFHHNPFAVLKDSSVFIW
jgi:hypothetical protein